MSDKKQSMIIPIIIVAVIICIVAVGAYIVLSNHNATVTPEPSASAAQSDTSVPPMTPSEIPSGVLSPTAMASADATAGATAEASTAVIPANGPVSPGEQSQATSTPTPVPSDALAAPTLISPANNAILTNVPKSVKFTWSPVPGATKYRFVEYVLGNNVWLDQHNEVVQGTTFTDNSFPGTTGNWMVYSINDSTGTEKISGWSDTWRFDFASGPSSTPTATAKPTSVQILPTATIKPITIKPPVLSTKPIHP